MEIKISINEKELRRHKKTLKSYLERLSDVQFVKKNMTITQKEHDEWHKKHKEYDEKSSKEHDACHRKFGIVVKNIRK
jgi:hypothetical protein